MSKLYATVFNEFQKELELCADAIFLHPLPFTQVNRLAMLAATVAERCIAQPIKIQFICGACTARLIIDCDESIWTLLHYCEECKASRTFLRDVVICEDEFHEPIPVSLYLFRAGGRYKIGSSIDPERRLRDFSASPIPVELIWSLQVEDAKKIEKQLHGWFKEKRCHGEWFELSETDVKYIKGLLEA